MPAYPGYGTRYDKTTGNAIDIARQRAPGAGLRLEYATAWCAKCQTDKSTKGGKKRAGMFFCAQCTTPKQALSEKEKPTEVGLPGQF